MMKGIFPGFIEIKYNYINVEGIFISTIAITDYMLKIEMLETIGMLYNIGEIDISFHIQRQNNADFLKKLTNIIAEYSSEKKSVSNNQIDINILDNIKQRASILRRKIQIDGEQIYGVNTYLVIKSESKEESIRKTRQLINGLYTHNLIAKPCNFKQRQAYLASLPLMLNLPEISKSTQTIMTESAMAKLFPFYTKNFIQNEGIVLGKIDKEICLIDIFSPKSNNYNMCIFGSSGTGKSYFVKLNIIRNAYKGIKQIIIDPEGEYLDLIKTLGGVVYTDETYNPFVIPESYVKQNKNFFEDKVKMIVAFLVDKYGMTESSELKDCIRQLYYEHGITENKESLYETGNESVFYATPKYKVKFPDINDLKEKLGSVRLIGKEQIREVKNDYEHQTEEVNLFCFNLKNKNIEEITKLMRIFFPKIYELIEKKTIIYFDEVWKCIGQKEDRYAIDNIYNMFKTLRKQMASIVIISQDIGDLFAFDEGNFGKSILNNSNIKALFKMEWTELELLRKMNFSAEVLDIIQVLERTKVYIKIMNTSFTLKVEATEYEHMLIEGEGK